MSSLHDFKPNTDLLRRSCTVKTVVPGINDACEDCFFSIFKDGEFTGRCTEHDLSNVSEVVSCPDFYPTTAFGGQK